jgi:hypothetical protein
MFKMEKKKSETSNIIYLSNILNYVIISKYVKICEEN